MVPGYLVDEIRNRIRSRRAAMQLQTRVIGPRTIGQGELIQKVKTKINEIKTNIKNRLEQRGTTVVYTPPSQEIITPATVVTPTEEVTTSVGAGFIFG